MRSSVLPLVEPDGPVIGSFAACLEDVESACFFPDRRGFPTEMLAINFLFLPKVRNRARGKGTASRSKLQILVCTALVAAYEAFSRILLHRQLTSGAFTQFQPGQDHNVQEAQCTLIRGRYTFRSRKQTTPTRKDVGRLHVCNWKCSSRRSGARRLLRPIRQPRSA